MLAYSSVQQKLKKNSTEHTFAIYKFPFTFEINSFRGNVSLQFGK